MNRLAKIFVFLVVAAVLAGNIQFVDHSKPIGDDRVQTINPAQAAAGGIIVAPLPEGDDSPTLPTLIQSDDKIFSDTAGHWAQASIGLIKSMGICQGYPDGSFRPDEALSQLEALQLLMPLLEIADINETVQLSQAQIAALPPWGQKAAQKAAQAGLIDLDDFAPAQPLERAFLVSWLMQIGGDKPDCARELPFADAESFAPQLTEALACLYQQGIIKGYPDGKFHPQQAVSRADMMVILTRLLSAADPVRLTVLSVNDFHGALAESGSNPGAAKLAAYLNTVRARNPQGTILLSGGDMMQGSLDSNLLQGEPVIAVMNAIGFEAMTLGNHEFDWDIDVLEKRAEQANFPFLCCNIIDKRTGEPLPFTKPYLLVDKAGVKIGIIGFTTPETATKVIPNIIDNYKITEPTDIVNSLVKQLRQSGVQIIIVVGHSGAYLGDDGRWQGEAALIAQSLQDVDVFLTAHTHQQYAAGFNGMAMVQAGYNGWAVAAVDLYYSPAGKKVFTANLQVSQLQEMDLYEDDEIKTILANNNEKIGPVKEQIIGENQRDLPHNKMVLSPLGQWFTDTLRRVGGADIAFINGGALRTDIPAGKITVGKMWEVLPFDNTLCILDLSAEQIREVLRHGMLNEQFGMVQYSGLQVQYDRSLPLEQRLVKVTLSDGTPLQDDRTYRVAINDFLAAGGDGFTVFTQCPYLTNTQEPIREMIIEAIKQEQNLDFSGDNRLQLLN